MDARILTIKNLINPAVMPGLGEISGQVINTHAADTIGVIIDNIPARSIISAIGTSVLTADGTTPLAVGNIISDGTKAGTKKVRFNLLPLNTLSFVVKYSESEVITPISTDVDVTLTALQ